MRFITAANPNGWIAHRLPALAIPNRKLMKILLLVMLLAGFSGRSLSAETDPTTEEFLKLPDVDAFYIYIDAKKT